ncbi:hypothetical protein Lal_00036272 [Lupinus albus]|uniref:Uncharacterized protein n=1 Tax=Lupinus albus TaxID=3870 RepID=A0A6A4P5G2_LUPAL|nr:hypothetical protein Lalb_Chr18g0047601 [Lupinus albus]KAF1891925.1 hypothetical protein Lal_00036272 [Lupinus albus]
MPEARDRRVVRADVAAIYVRRRASVLFGSDIYNDSTGSGLNRFGGSRTLVARDLGVRNENTPLSAVNRRSSLRRVLTTRRSVLPSWYPRTPLRDITAVVRAIERRRTRFGEEEGQQTGNLFQTDQQLPHPSVPASGAQLEHNPSAISPNQVSVKLRTPFGCKVPKIMLDIATPSLEESVLTPQKQLLNSIDTVEKIVKEELLKLKRTPSAKKAERDKRVRTLLSMR